MSVKRGRRAPDLPAGRFSDWLREIRVALRGVAGMDVPCGDCVACCTSSYFIHVEPWESAVIDRVPNGILCPAPGLPAGHAVLGYDAEGRCPLVEGRRCSIYSDRPLTCRRYDCRVFAAAAIDADRPAITRRTRRWRFDHPTPDDLREHEATMAAAGFLKEHGGRLPAHLAPHSPPGLAVLAVTVYDAFLEQGCDDDPRHASWVDAQLDAIGRAVQAFTPIRHADGEGGEE